MPTTAALLPDPPAANPGPAERIHHPRPLSRLNTPVIVLLLGVFLLSLGLNLYRNNFPYFYHADEPGKARQIIQDQRNFNHPLFMLEVADGAASLLRLPQEPQVIVELGRCLSAVYLALTTLCISWLIWQWWGVLTAALAGVLLAMAPDFVELSHYFKEDPALALGLALFFAGALLWEARGGWSRLILFGLVAGMCASTKYIGLVALPLGLGLIMWRGWEIGLGTSSWVHRKHVALQTVVYLVTALVAITAINYPMLSHRKEAAASFERETELVAKGQAGMRKDTPHSGFVERFAKRAGVLLPYYFIGWWAFWSAGRARRRWRSEWMYIVFPLILTLLLSFSAKDSGRYFLPAIPGIISTGAIGLAIFCAWLWRCGQWQRGVAIAVGLAVVVAAAFRAGDYLDGFRHDARLELLNYLKDNVPADAVVLQGDRVFLPGADNRYRDGWRVKATQEIRTARLVADFATSPQELVAQGITYVAMHEAEYGRYTRDDIRPSAQMAEDYKRRRAFYEGLFAEFKPVWESEAGKIGTHNPPLRLYKIGASQQNAK